MYYNFFIHSSVDGNLACFHILAIVNCTAVKNEIHVSFSILVSSGYMPWSGIVGSYGDYISSFWRNLFGIGCINLQCHHQCENIPFTSHPFQHLFFIDFLLMSILTGVTWYLILVLICICLIMSNIEYMFISLLAICMYSLNKCLFMAFSHCLIPPHFVWVISFFGIESYDLPLYLGN